MTAQRRRLPRLLVDVTPLRRDHDFRWLWMGQAISGIGNQVTRLALPYQVYRMTGSTLAIAGLTLFQLIPILVFSLGAGSVADAVDRRRMLRLTQVAMMACSLALAILALQPSVPLLVLYAVAFATAAFGSLDQPARSSSIPRLVPRERLPAALALGQLNFQIASVAGPAVAGVLIATIGLAGAYFVDVVSFTASLVALAAIAPIPPLRGATRPGLEAIREGLRFARRRRVILSTYVIDLNAMIFGMPTSLFPALALDVFHAGPAGLGLLAAAPSVGALIGALLSGWVSIVRRVGMAVIVAVAIWGSRSPCSGCRRSRSPSPSSSSPWPAPPTCSRRSSGRPSSSPISFVAASRRSTSSSSRAARGSATSRPRSSRRWSASRRPSSAAASSACSAWSASSGSSPGWAGTCWIDPGPGRPRLAHRKRRRRNRRVSRDRASTRPADRSSTRA